MIRRTATKKVDKGQSEIRKNVLSAVQLRQYEARGYLKDLPVFDASGVADLQCGFKELASRLPEGIDINQVNMWHKCSPWYYEVCRTPIVLDYVESVLGPDFFQWGGQFFVKYPGDGSEVPWHQDSQYWPISPAKTASVWLAVYDVNEDNAAMQVMASSHLCGAFSHQINNATHYVLEQEADVSSCREEDVGSMNLKSGHMSLHDSHLLHRSGTYDSSRLRCGLAMRFSPTDVRCDLSVWPTFEAYLARGTDRYGLNPVGRVPTREGFPLRKHQHSSDFG